MDERLLRDEILTICKEAPQPLTVQELEERLSVQDADTFKELVKLLVQLEDEGTLIRTRSNRYGLPEQLNFLRGTYRAHEKGFAFVIVEGGGMDDIFIPPSETNEAMQNDTVLVRILDESRGDRREGTIVRIVERGVKEVVGTYQDHEYYGLVIPDDKKITADVLVSRENSKGAVDGHKVVARLTKYPEGRQLAQGEITDILGHKNDPGVDILSIIHKHGIPTEFPQEVLEHAESIPEKINEKDLEGRRDLREEELVTIDGADAKDLDDAVHVSVLSNGNYKLSVHIADVSHYVTEGSEIDREALDRGTSVYLVDRVIPMIPHRLSNGICSLNPQVDRLALSCEMEINEDGEVVSHEIFESVIQTNERMTYTDVNSILVDKDKKLREHYAPLVPMFEAMETLASILRRKRMHRGAIDFDFKEAKVIVNEDSKPVDVALRERSVAEKLIEEFMLAANETVAEHFHWMDVPFIYRIHEEPKEEKLQRFFEFITNFGLIVKGKANAIHPRALQEVIEAVAGKPEEMVVSTMMLRSMQQARYAPDSLGHFGLSAEFYTHFTSPIRRYPDLIVHRLIREYLIRGRIDEGTQNKWDVQLDAIADHTSKMERRAVDAERETDDLKKAEYMLDKVGEKFDAIISSVTKFGMFVELPNTIEGLIHVSEMTDDYYRFEERQMAMVGERTAKVFRLGDEITVQCISVNKDERSIDFAVVGMKENRRRETPLGDSRRRTEREGKPKRERSKRQGERGGDKGKSSRGDDRVSVDGWSNEKPKKKKKNNKKFYEQIPKKKRSRKPKQK